MLGNEPISSRRTASALNCWTIFSLLCAHFLRALDVSSAALHVLHLLSPGSIISIALFIVFCISLDWLNFFVLLKSHKYLIAACYSFSGIYSLSNYLFIVAFYFFPYWRIVVTMNHTVNMCICQSLPLSLNSFRIVSWKINDWIKVYEKNVRLLIRTAKMTFKKHTNIHLSDWV